VARASNVRAAGRRADRLDQALAQHQRVDLRQPGGADALDRGGEVVVGAPQLSGSGLSHSQ
jgi:hypothetical protein